MLKNLNMKSADQPDLNELVKKWQHRLRLDDWEIVVKWGRWHEMPGRENGYVNAQVSIDNENQCMSIVVADPNDSPSDLTNPRANDVEATVVHELLHAHFELFWPKDDDVKHILAERAVNVMAGVLVEADRVLQSQTHQKPQKKKKPSTSKS